MERPGISDDTVVIAVSRLRFRSPLRALQALWQFRSLYKRARSYPGFIRGEVGLANTSTLMNCSIWSSRRQMLAWSGQDDHVIAVRVSHCYTTEVWSAEAALRTVSHSAHDWDGTLVPAPWTSSFAPGGQPVAAIDTAEG